jgi:hypothetical protein
MRMSALASRIRRRSLSNPTGLTVRPPRTRLVHCLSLIMLQSTVGVCAVLNSRAMLTAFPSQVAFGVSNRTLLFA